MLRDLKYLLTGLFISAVLFIILAGAFVFISPESLSPAIPLPDFLNTSTATTQPPATPLPSTPTLSPPTSTVLPPIAPQTSTPAPATAIPTLSPGQAKLTNGSLTITGPLSPEEQVRLYDASLEFLASTPSQARERGERINGKGYGSPSLICGPLSIAILSAAGLLPASTVPYDFWMLNPDDGVARQKLKSTFPPEKYTDTRIRTRIDQVDWKSQPLQPGDFIYLYAGNGGNFEHMLVVNRVDNAGRAYSVTNVNTPDGFVIQEVMLYDPNDNQAGIFSQWTERQWALLGSTGYGGFELWRIIPNTPITSP